MRTTYLRFLIFTFLSLASEGLIAQSAHLVKGTGNPIIPGYFADPTVKKFGDTYYIYATTDGNGGGFGPSQVWTSKDFVNWTMQDMNWPTTHYYWAPDATKGPDGKYYLYYCQPVEIYGASSSSPVGPWTSLLEPGKPIVANFLVPNVITLDGQTFKDDDGKYYMYWGTWGIYPKHGAGVGLLNADMKSFSKLGQIPNTDAKDFFEAPFTFKRKGIYYFTYSSGYCEDGTYRVQYATASNPMGPFKYGKNNPILSTNADGTVHGPGHQSVLQEGNDYYLIYHRHNNPHNDGGYHRQVAADKMIFDEKGNILKLVPSHSGIGYLGKNSNPHPNLALGKHAVASSIYDQDFKAEYALDDNNGTLWKPKDNLGSSWLRVDLGKIFDVRSVHTQFEYATWYYQYKIEYSVDGKSWKLYADRSRNTRHGSPMIDFGNVNARYLRMTIMRTEYPGLNKAVWNMKVFDDPEYNPVMNTNSKKWEPLKRFEAKGLIVDLNIKDLRVGSSVKQVLNTGKLSGIFSANSSKKPITSMVSGIKALVFSGEERLSSSVPAPSSMLGNSSYSVSMWVLNPEIDKQESIVSWTNVGGVNLSNASVGYGASKSAGAASHLGWADLGYKHLPKANEWHHIAMVFDGTMERIYVDGILDRAERRMLFITKLSRFLVGGNKGTEAGFSGALASLKIYDVPLSSEQIKTTYAKGLSSLTTVYADARNLEYGKLDHWTNNGAVLSKFIATGKVEVGDKGGKIAVVLTNGAKLYIDDKISKQINSRKPFSAIFSISQSGGSHTNLYFGKQRKAVSIAGDGKWQHVICSFNSRQFQVFVNGRLRKDVFTPNRNKNDQLLVEPFGQTTGATMAISSIVVYSYVLNPKKRLQEFSFWKATMNTKAICASFASNPSAITPNMVYMAANKPNLPGGQLEFLFERSKQESGAKWLRASDFTDFSVSAEASYTYTVKVRDNFGNVTGTSLPKSVRTDSSLFLIKRQSGSGKSIPLQATGLPGTSWDGLEGAADTVIQQSGILKMVSHNTVFDGSATTGPFAYNDVVGDFVAEVTLTDMLGLNERVAHGANEAGIMVKIGQTGKKLVQSGVMPGWGVGNIVTNLGDDGRKQSNNQAGWAFYKHLQIQRLGNTFFLRGSHDRKTWISLPGSPMLRNDMGANIKLQVGVYHATYGDVFGYGSFSDFRLVQKKSK
jgi:beta-xylosidase